MDFKKIVDSKSIKELAFASFYYASGSIFGPLLVFGGLGYLLDTFFDSRPTFIIVGVFVAFITTNIFLYKKVISINRLITEYGQKKPNAVTEKEQADNQKTTIIESESQRKEK